MLGQLLLLLHVHVLFLFSLTHCLKIAVIGGGIGGAASVFHLRKLLPSSVNVDCITDGELGGRLTTVSMEVNGKHRLFEAGGTSIHPKNEYMRQWLHELGLSKAVDSESSKKTGIWNGKKFVVRFSDWWIVGMYRLLRRYGFDIIRNEFFLRNRLSEFTNIYRSMSANDNFDDIASMALSMSSELAVSLNMSAKEYFSKHNLGMRFQSEMATAISRLNYGQTLQDLRGFAGTVSMAGAQAGLYSINGSNKIVVEKLFEQSGCNKRNMLVTKVSKNQGLLTIESLENGHVRIDEGYDYIILAVPLHQDQKIVIDGVSKQHFGHYKKIFATFIEGSLRLSQWNLRDTDHLSSICVASNDPVYYNAIFEKVPVDYRKGDKLFSNVSTGIYKVFSGEALTIDQLNELFAEIRVIKTKEFLAYPDYAKPPIKHPRFRLVDRICHINAIEWMASAIEMSAIGARNCVNMLIDDLNLHDNGFEGPNFDL